MIPNNGICPGCGKKLRQFSIPRMGIWEADCCMCAVAASYPQANPGAGK